MKIINRSDINTLVNLEKTIKSKVEFTTEYTHTSTQQDGDFPQKITIENLKKCINELEQKFSNNCNCLTNPNCCQGCQSAQCQSYSCQKVICQSCQANPPNCSCSDWGSH